MLVLLFAELFSDLFVDLFLFPQNAKNEKLRSLVIYGKEKGHQQSLG